MGLEDLKELEKNISEATPSPVEATPSPVEATPPEKKKQRRRRKHAGIRKQKIARGTGGKFVSPEEEEPEEEFEIPEEDKKLFFPLISNITNLLFSRLHWNPLSFDEAKLLTNSVLPVYYKYLPSFLDKYSEELNLALTVGMIILPRSVSKETPTPDEKSAE